jgi:hypothetical protein
MHSISKTHYNRGFTVLTICIAYPLDTKFCSRIMYGKFINDIKKAIMRITSKNKTTIIAKLIQ